MPPVEVCPSVADYQKMLSGEAPPSAVADLAGHLETCDRCAATIHSLLNDDSLSDSVRASGAAPSLGHLPPELVSKLLSLSGADVPMAAPVGETQVTVDGARRAARLGDATVFVTPGMTAPQAADELGRLGGYRILEVLGEGGMGLVYRAEDVQLQRLVALKVMKPDLARNDNSRKRFLAEARAAAKVRSDHVVTIYQTGEDGHTAFAAMELLRGEPLDHWLRTHREPPLNELMRIGREMALGLSAAHDEGLIHRDIKPANVWIESSGRVKILDFGLARSAQGDVHLTNSGAVVGTPAYMAPEQAAGHKVDHRADLFSLGCVLHRMTTGQMPFKGETVMSILTALAIETPPPAHELNPAVPLRLSELISRLLIKDPNGRPPTALAVADELKAILAGEVARHEPSTVQYVPQPAPIVLPLPSESPNAFDFSADTDVVGPRAARRAPEPEDASEDDLPPVRRPAAKSRKPLVFVAVAVVLFFALAGGVLSQFIFATKDGTLVVEVDDDADVRFKKGGKLELYDDNGKLRYTIEASEKNKTLAAGKYLVKVVGADGVKLETDTFELEKKGKVSVRVRAAGPVQVAGLTPKKDAPVGKEPPKDPVKVGGTVALPPSALGAALALRKGTWEPGPSENILPGVIPRPRLLDGVARWQITPTATVEPWAAPAWSPDGKLIALGDGPYVRIYDAQTGALTGVGLRKRPGFHHLAQVRPMWSADSKWVRLADHGDPGFTSGSVFAADGTPAAAPWIQNAGHDYGWNPKYSVFACVVQLDTIQFYDPTQAKPIEVETKHGAKGKAVWSPDGEWLLVVRENKTAQLFGRDGTPGAKLAGEVDPTAPPAWTADSSRIAAPISATEIGFWKKDGTAAGKTAAQDKPTLSLHWRPDGKAIGVVAAEGMRYFWTADGQSEGSVDTKGEPGLTWAKDGKGFFTPGMFWPTVGPAFTSVARPNAGEVLSPDTARIAYLGREIVVSELKIGEPKEVAKWPAGVLAAWSADGQRLVVTDEIGAVVYDARDAAKVVRLGAPAAPGLNRVALSPKGDRLALASNLGTLCICEPTGKVLRLIPLTAPPAPPWNSTPSAVHDIQWHPDGKFLAVTTGSSTVTVFDTDSGKAEAATSVEGNRPGGSAVFSPANPDHIIIAHPDAAALWRWKVEREPALKFAGLGKLLPAPDGKRVLSLHGGSGIHGNDPLPAAILSPDLKNRDTTGTKDYVQSVNHPGPSLAWHPDGKHLVVTRNGEFRDIQIRALDGKVVESIKPDGIDITWLEWATPAVGNVLVGRLTNQTDTYLFDLVTKKLTPFGKVNGALTLSLDGKHLIAADGSILTYWSLETKAVQQKVLLLTGGEFVTFSAAGEVLAQSAKAAEYFRYLVEDKTGRLAVKTPAEMAPSLPTAAEEWRPTPEHAAYVKAVAALPAEKQVEAVVSEMKKRNPDFDGYHASKVENGAVTEFGFDGSKVADVSPVRALPGLKKLSARHLRDNNNWELPLKDLSPLKGLKLVELELGGTQVSDLSPLVGMPLERLGLRQTGVTDLSPLRGMPLNNLDVMNTAVADLSPLKEMPLEHLACSKEVKSLAPLAGMKLKTLQGLGNVTDLSLLKGMPLQLLTLLGDSSTDLSPIKDAPLKDLFYVAYQPDRDRAFLKSIKTLETFNGRPAKDLLGDK